MTNKNACTTLHKRCCPPPNLAITRKWHRLTKNLGYSGARASPSSPLHSHSAKPRNSTITTRMRQNATKCYRFSEHFRIDRFSRFPFRPPLDHSAKPPQLRACPPEPTNVPVAQSSYRRRPVSRGEGAQGWIAVAPTSRVCLFCTLWRESPFPGMTGMAILPRYESKSPSPYRLAKACSFSHVDSSTSMPCSSPLCVRRCSISPG